MTRFRLDSLVDLGDGWARLPEPGEEVYRLILGGIAIGGWMTEAQLGELELGGMPAVIESVVWP